MIQFQDGQTLFYRTLLATAEGPKTVYHFKGIITPENEIPSTKK